MKSRKNGEGESTLWRFEWEDNIKVLVCCRFPNANPGNSSQGGTGGDQGNFQDDGDDDLYS